MKALTEIGWRRAARFGLLTLAHGIVRLVPVPQWRAGALRPLGASIGSDVIVHAVRFINMDRTGFRGLRLGRACFLGDECLLDLADRVVFEDQVTLAQRVTVLTHTNVGYRDHPLQPFLPASTAPVTIRRGAFIGACATILPGVEIGEMAIVGAGALVRDDVPPRTLVAGVPARVIRAIDDTMPRAARRHAVDA